MIAEARTSHQFPLSHAYAVCVVMVPSQVSANSAHVYMTLVATLVTQLG